MQLTSTNFVAYSCITLLILFAQRLVIKFMFSSHASCCRWITSKSSFF